MPKSTGGKDVQECEQVSNCENRWVESICVQQNMASNLTPHLLFPYQSMAFLVGSAVSISFKWVELQGCVLNIDCQLTKSTL